MRFFLDANILFSAANSRGRVQQTLQQLADIAPCVTCDLALQEAERNLQRKHPDWLPGLQQLLPCLETTTTVWLDHGAGLPEKDQPILASAVHARASHLVTGDLRHFGSLMGHTIGGVKVVTLRMLAEELAL